MMIHTKNKCMKNILGLILVLGLISCSIPYQITETYTTDSTGKTVKTIHKYFDNTTVVSPPAASLNVVTSPLWWGSSYYYQPYYVPRITVPIHPIPRTRNYRH